MPYTLHQLEQLDEVELLSYCENNIDDLVTSTTELVLINRLKRQLDVDGGHMPMSEVKDLLADIDAQIPGEDFLADLIAECNDITAGNYKKAELITFIQGFANVIENKQQELASGFEFARDIINRTINPKL